MHLACLSCSTLPSGFVRSSEGFVIPGVCDNGMSLDECTHSCIAKNMMPVCRVCSVGLCNAMTSGVGLLSLQMGVGSVCSNPSFRKIDQMHLAVLAAVTAATNSASVELNTVSN